MNTKNENLRLACASMAYSRAATQCRARSAEWLRLERDGASPEALREALARVRKAVYKFVITESRVDRLTGQQPRFVLDGEMIRFTAPGREWIAVEPERLARGLFQLEQAERTKEQNHAIARAGLAFDEAEERLSRVAHAYIRADQQGRPREVLRQLDDEVNLAERGLIVADMLLDRALGQKERWDTWLSVDGETRRNVSDAWRLLNSG